MQSGGVSQSGGSIEVSWNVSAGESFAGYYTAGCDACLKPVDAVESLASGDWRDAIWREHLSTGTTPLNLPVGPNYKRVYIRNGHTVTISQSGVDAMEVHIEEGGRLVVEKTVKCARLGLVRGAGVLATKGFMPQGDFSQFLGCDNEGKLEFAGEGNYPIDVPGGFTAIPYLWTSGSGRRYTPDKDITVCRQLLIRETSILDNTHFQRGPRILGTMQREHSAGFRTMPLGGGWVELAGGEPQEIKGFDGENRFNELIVNNPNDVNIPANESVSAVILRLRDGHLKTRHADGVGKLTIDAHDWNFDLSGAPTDREGRATSFVQGPMTIHAEGAGGTAFRFPLGNANAAKMQLGNQFFFYDLKPGSRLEVEFFFPNPMAGQLAPPVKYADPFGYWRVKNPDGLSVDATTGARILYSDVSWAKTMRGADLAVGEFSPGLVTMPGSESKWHWKDADAEVTVNSNVKFVTSMNLDIPAVGKDLTLVSKQFGSPILTFQDADPQNCMKEEFKDFRIGVIAQVGDWTFPIRFTLRKTQYNGVPEEEVVTISDQTAYDAWSRRVFLNSFETYVIYELVDFRYTEINSDAELTGRGQVEGILRFTKALDVDQIHSVVDYTRQCVESGSTSFKIKFEGEYPNADVNYSWSVVGSGSTGEFDPPTGLWTSASEPPHTNFKGFQTGESYTIRLEMNVKGECAVHKDFNLTLHEYSKPTFVGSDKLCSPQKEFELAVHSEGYTGNYIWEVVDGSASGTLRQAGVPTGDRNALSFGEYQFGTTRVKVSKDIECRADTEVEKEFSYLWSPASGRIVGPLIVGAKSGETEATKEYLLEIPSAEQIYAKSANMVYLWSVENYANPEAKFSPSSLATQNPTQVIWSVVPNPPDLTHYRSGLKLNVATKDGCIADFAEVVLVIIRLGTGPVYHVPNFMTP